MSPPSRAKNNLSPNGGAFPTWKHAKVGQGGLAWAESAAILPNWRRADPFPGGRKGPEERQISAPAQQAPASEEPDF